MLIEFSIANYRSFRERQTLSMVAAPRLHRRENVFKPVLTGEKFPELLKACVIYGPNASGKSNLLRALEVVDSIARREASAVDTALPVDAFKFDQELADKPSLFELHFVQGGLRYQFNVAVTRERITGERLLAFPKGKETLLYERKYVDHAEAYLFGPQLEGGSDLHETWRKLTSPKVLFLSQAVANSAEDLRQLRIPFRWLTGAILPLLSGMGHFSRVSQRLASNEEAHAEEIASFLQEVDVPISKIKVTQQESQIRSQGRSAESNPLVTRSKLQTKLTHKTALGEADLAYEEQSEGTKNLIGFWLPWTTREPSENGARCVLVVDELDNSLHPKIVAALVAKHLQSESPSQLIFSTHDTHLMDAKLLRRDQIWITERDANGATQLRCIHDFSGRETEDIEKRYYEGRYRGLPLLKSA